MGTSSVSMSTEMESPLLPLGTGSEWMPGNCPGWESRKPETQEVTNMALKSSEVHQHEELQGVHLQRVLTHELLPAMVNKSEMQQANYSCWNTTM